MEFRGMKFDTASEALQWREAEGGEAVMMDEGIFLMARSEADRLQAAGVEMAYLEYHEFDGETRILTTPVN